MASRNQLEQQALKAIQRGQPQKAVRAYLNILRMDKRDRRIRQKLGELYIKLERQQEGMKYLGEAAELAVREGQPRAAISIYKRMIGIDPHDGELVVRLADAYARAELGPEAERLYDQAINVFANQRDFDQAVRCARKLLSFRPTDMALRFRVAEFLQKGEQDDEALAAYRDLVTRLQRRGEMGEVARAAEKALSIDDSDVELRLVAAEARLENHEADAALEHLEKIRTAMPRDPRVLDLLGRAWLAQDRPENARDHLLDLADIHARQDRAEDEARVLRTLVDAGIDSPDIRNRLGEASRQAERQSRRLTDISTFVPGDDAEVVASTRAEVFSRYGFSDRAHNTLAEAHAKHPQSFAITVRLAEALVDLDRTDAALELLQPLLERARGQAAKAIRDRIEVLGGELPDAAPSPEPTAKGTEAGSDEPDLTDDELIDEDLIDEDLIDDAILDDELIDDDILDDGESEGIPGHPSPASAAEDEPSHDEDTGEEEFVFEMGGGDTAPSASEPTPEPPGGGPVAELRSKARAARRAGDLAAAIRHLQEAYKLDPTDEEILLEIGDVREAQREARQRTAAPSAGATPAEPESSPASSPEPSREPAPEPEPEPEGFFDLDEDALSPAPPSSSPPAAEDDEDAAWDALLATPSPQEEAPSPSGGAPEPAAPEPAAPGGSEDLAEARALSAVGLVQEALDALGRHAGLEARWLEARTRREAGDLGAALSDLRTALADAEEDDPFYLPALLELARIYTRTNRIRAALRLVDEIRDLDPRWHTQEVTDLERGARILSDRR